MALKIAIIIFLLLCVVGAGIVAGIFFGLFGDEFEITKEDLKIEASNSVVVDANGAVIANLSGDEKRKAANLLALKYNPSASTSSRDEYIDSLFDKMCIFSLSIEHLSGKEGLENLKKRNPQEASPLG